LALTDLIEMNTRFTLLVLALIAMVFPLKMNGQGVVSSAKITVSSGTVMSISGGGFTNNSGGGVTNNGEMQLDGDWANNDGFGVFGSAPTAGLVTMNGGSQAIGGSNATNFYDLAVVAAGGGDKTMNVDVNVFDVLTLNTHEMILNSNDLTLENSSTGALAGSGGIVSETGGTLSNLRWNIGNNVGNYTIPFETTSGIAINFGYNITSAGTGTANPYKQFATYPTDNSNSVWPPGVTHVTDDYNVPSHFWVTDRFWVIDNDITPVNHSVYPQIEYDFVFNPADNVGSNLITEANLVAQRFNDVENKWLDWLYSDYASGGSVTVDLANSLDYFKTWTLVDDSDPLPVELAKFDGQCNSGEINLTWTTWTESQNEYFTVERSGDGEHFEMVDIVEGAGNSNQAVTYNIKDKAAYGGTSYYRLKDTDVRGEENYSEVIAVTCEGSGNEFSLLNAYENQNGLIIDFTASQNEPYKITLMDSRGRELLIESSNAYEGYNQIALPVIDLARGVYILKLTNSKKQFGKRILLN
jgi:hypothetical protein